MNTILFITKYIVHMYECAPINIVKKVLPEQVHST